MGNRGAMQASMNREMMKWKRERSSQASKKTQKTFKRPATTSTANEPFLVVEKFILGLIVAVATLSIVVAIVAEVMYNPEAKAEESLAEMATDYYENRLYKQLVGLSEKPEEILAEYTESGVPTVYLRQILLYDNGKNEEKATDFSNGNFECNTNQTGVRFYPQAPYGPSDFRAEYLWDCERK